MGIHSNLNRNYFALPTQVHMGIHTWSGASRRGRRMSLELPFNGSMPLMLQNPDFLQRHSDFFHPYPPTHLLGRMQQQHSMEQQQQQMKLERGVPPPSQQQQQQQQPLLNLAHKYMSANGAAAAAAAAGLAAHHHQMMAAAAAAGGHPSILSGGGGDGRAAYISTPSPSGSDKQISPANSLRDEIMMDSPKRNGGGDDVSPAASQTVTPDLSPRLWKLHYESKAVNRESLESANKTDSTAKSSVEELIV